MSSINSAIKLCRDYAHKKIQVCIFNQIYIFFNCLEYFYQLMNLRLTRYNYNNRRIICEFKSHLWNHYFVIVQFAVFPTSEN